MIGYKTGQTVVGTVMDRVEKKQESLQELFEK